MNKILREVSLQVVPPLSSVANKFLRETRCVTFCINEALGRNVSSDIQKLAVQLWPCGMMKEKRIVPVMLDPISSVYLVELEYDFQEYYSISSQSERLLEASAIIRDAISRVHSDCRLESESLLAIVSDCESKAFVFEQHFGRPLPVGGGQATAQLFLRFDCDAIQLGLTLSRSENKSTWQYVFHRCSTFDIGVAYEIGKIEIAGKNELVYKPKSVFEDIEIDLSDAGL